MNTYLFVVFDTVMTEIAHREKFACRTVDGAMAHHRDLLSSWNSCEPDRYIVYGIRI